MFYVFVDAVIREWLCWMLDKEAAHSRFEQASRERVFFLLMMGGLDHKTPFGCRAPLPFL
jgi:hypothetical protein